MNAGRRSCPPAKTEKKGVGAASGGGVFPHPVMYFGRMFANTPDQSFRMQLRYGNGSDGCLTGGSYRMSGLSALRNSDSRSAMNDEAFSRMARLVRACKSAASSNTLRLCM